MTRKIAIIGAGHNALVAAAYLAKAGHSVEVFESRSVVGGCASSDTTTFPGFTLSTASYLNSLFSNDIVRDLDLPKFGYEVKKRDPSSFTPTRDGEYLMLGPNMEANQREIAKFSTNDALAYPDYEHELEALADWMAATMSMTMPNIPPRSWRDVKNSLDLTRHATKISLRHALRLHKLIREHPAKYLDGWFESEVLKATLLTDALIGAVEFSGYVLLHHVMGDAGGARGVWGFMKGGMGGLSSSIAKSAESFGAKIYCNTVVESVITDGGGVACGVMVRKSPGASPTLVLADIVISGISPLTTFDKLLSGNMNVEKECKRLATRDVKTASMKVNCTLKGLPNFFACPGVTPGPQHRGTIHLPDEVSAINEAIKELKRGLPSTRPMLEITLPSVHDDTLAPAGCHVMNIFVQFTPYHHPSGSWSETEKMRYFNENILGVMREYVSNVDDIIGDVQVLAPPDLEREFGLIGGNIFNMGMGLDQLGPARPLLGMADYRTPISGLYLTGAATHPGGGVTGVSGYNVAREILNDIAKCS